MPDDPTKTGSDPKDPTDNGGEPGKGTDPTKTGNEPGTSFDPAKLGDEDLKKVLEDPRIWQTERLKGLRESDKRLKQIEKEQADAEKKKLEEQGEFEKLAGQNAKERDEAQGRVKQLEMQQNIMAEAVKKGITDLDAATKLINTEGIKQDDDGNWSGISEAVEALTKDRPYLVNSTTSVGNPTNPASPSTPPGKFKMTQIQDPKFYQEHRDEIMEAQRTGNIIDDRHQPQTTAS